jgi:hypothetical protein
MHSVATIGTTHVTEIVMADRYRISPAQTPHPRSVDDGSDDRGGVLRPVLWIVLILSATANGTLSGLDANPVVSVGFGLITLACAASLVVHHYRHRRR